MSVLIPLIVIILFIVMQRPKDKKEPKKRKHKMIAICAPRYDHRDLQRRHNESYLSREHNDNYVDFRNITNDDSHYDSSLDRLNEFWMDQGCGDGRRIKDIYNDLTRDIRGDRGDNHIFQYMPVMN